MLVSFNSHFSEISIYLGRRPTLTQQLGYAFLSNEEQGLEFKGDPYWYIFDIQNITHTNNFYYRWSIFFLPKQRKISQVILLLPP